MTEKHYRQLLRNRQPRAARPLFGTGADQNLLRTVARGVRRCERARNALEQILPPEWLAAVRVEGLERGTLTLAVDSPAVGTALRRDEPRLRQQLAQRVPGVRHLRVAQRGGD